MVNISVQDQITSTDSGPLLNEYTFSQPDGKCVSSINEQISNEVRAPNYKSAFVKSHNLFLSLLTEFPALCGSDRRRSTASGCSECNRPCLAQRLSEVGLESVGNLSSEY